MNAEIDSLTRSLQVRVKADPLLARLDLLPLVRPSIRLNTQRVPFAHIELGATRIGGTPDVPPEFDWPRWMPTEERQDILGNPFRPDIPAPLGFIAQIDLNALPHVDDALPRSGWLYFFYDRNCEPWGFDPADRGCCRVVYENCERNKLARMHPPPDDIPNFMPHPCSVQALPELTLPEEVPGLKYGAPGYDAYRILREELVGSSGSCHHRLLGNSQLVQSPWELECQLVTNGLYCGDSTGYQCKEAETLKAGARDWRLLLQIDSDEDGPGWMWGDVGRIYYCIRQQDLEARNFENVWLIFQCC